MNNFKLSLVTVLAMTSLTTAATAADSLADAFKNGKVKGEIKSFYYARGFSEASSKKDASVFVNGGSLGYVTDAFKGIKLGATFQTSHMTSSDTDAEKAYKSDMDASGSRLSEAYIQYNMGKTSIKAGRQYIKTPLISGSPARMIKESFEGYTLTNKSFANTKIFAGYLTKFQARTDLNGGVGEFDDAQVGVDGTWTLYVQNKSVPGLTLDAQYYDRSETTEGGNDGLSNLFLNAQYKFKAPLKPFIGAQYYKSSFDSASKEDNDLVGLKAGFTVKGVTLFAGYTETGKGSKVEHGIGLASWKHFTSTTAYGGENAFNPETESVQFGVKTKFGPLGVQVRYTDNDVKTNGTSVKTAGLKETALNLSYKFSGSLKNLLLFVDYVDIDSDLNNQQDSELRTRLIYKF